MPAARSMLTRLTVIRAVVVATLAACIALSRPLWGTVREFPPAPLVALPPLPDALSPWLVALLVVLLALALAPRRWTPLPFIAVAAALALWDQARLQPWLYQGALFLGAFALSDRPRPILQLVLTATYVWSGISKLNPDFGQGVLPWAVAAAGTRATLPVEWLAALGVAVGVIEAAIGVALLLPRPRRAAAMAAVAMHGLLLLVLGPLGHGWNPVVWPWNLGMAALVLLLFWDETSAPRPILWSADWYHRALLVLVGILPALHPVGLWDAYLSFSLYSLNVDEAWLAAERGAAASLGPQARAVAEAGTDGRLIIRFLPWAMRDLGTPAYPERRAHVAAFRVQCRRASRPADLRLIVVRSRPLFAAARPEPEVFTCRDVR